MVSMSIQVLSGEPDRYRVVARLSLPSTRSRLELGMWIADQVFTRHHHTDLIKRLDIC